MADRPPYKVRVMLHGDVRAALFARQNESGWSLNHEINKVLRKALAAQIARLPPYEATEAGETPCTQPN
jgi:hypothetical protein